MFARKREEEMRTYSFWPVKLGEDGVYEFDNEIISGFGDDCGSDPWFEDILQKLGNRPTTARVRYTTIDDDGNWIEGEVEATVFVPTVPGEVAYVDVDEQRVPILMESPAVMEYKEEEV